MHPKNFYAKSFYTTAFANGGKKVYDNCTTLVSDEQEKEIFLYTTFN